MTGGDNPCDFEVFLAANLKHDDRISARRRMVFEQILAKTFDEAPLWKALNDYYNTHIKSAKSPHFSDIDLNEHNFIPLAESLDPETALCHVITLNRYIREAGPLLPGNRSGPKKINSFEVTATELSQLSALSDEERKEYVANLLSIVLQRYQTKVYNGPWWATTWSNFEQSIIDSVHDFNDASNWSNLLGLARHKGTWLAVIKYSVREVDGPLYRPTQLDAGPNPWHFPSPGSIPRATGGHPMDLSDKVPSRLLNEYLHAAPNGLTSNNVVAVAEVETDMVKTDVVKSLTEIRIRHRERLTGKYPDIPTQWMPMK